MAMYAGMNVAPWRKENLPGKPHLRAATDILFVQIPKSIDGMKRLGKGNFILIKGTDASKCRIAVINGKAIHHFLSETCYSTPYIIQFLGKKKNL